MHTPQRGPKAARGEVRHRLLEAARHQFSENTFSNVTLRGIAAEAGVDPGLISYYFGGKTGLFRESMSLPRDPGAIIMASLGDNLDGAGERALHALFDQWRLAESSETSSRQLIQSLLESPTTLDTFHVWIDEEIITPVSHMLAGPKKRERAAAAVGTVFQLLSIRYVVKIEPIASLSDEEVIALYAPVIQRFLTPEQA